MKNKGANSKDYREADHFSDLSKKLREEYEKQNHDKDKHSSFNEELTSIVSSMPADKVAAIFGVK
jgi:flagellar motility protein MotE (MotC chaperone)